MRTFASAVFILLLSSTAAAQQRPIFDIDDFVDPREHAAPVFAARLVAGGALNFIDDYRPSHHDAAVIHFTASFYWSNYQLDYKRSEVRDGPPARVQMCACEPPIFFPTPPSSESTPLAPPPGGKDTVQAAAYYFWPWPRAGTQPVMLRARLTLTHQQIDTVATFPNSSVPTHLSGRELTLGIETDTYIPVGRGIFGSLQYAKTERSGTAADRTQHELTYTNRFPGFAVRDAVIVRPLLTVGAVTGRGGTGINLVNPLLEAFLPYRDVNFHLIYSPQSTRSGAGGWETHHQIALFADWGKVWFFKKHASSS